MLCALSGNGFPGGLCAADWKGDRFPQWKAAADSAGAQGKNAAGIGKYALWGGNPVPRFDGEHQEGQPDTEDVG